MKATKINKQGHNDWKIKGLTFAQLHRCDDSFFLGLGAIYKFLSTHFPQLWRFRYEPHSVTNKTKDCVQVQGYFSTCRK